MKNHFLKLKKNVLILNKKQQQEISGGSMDPDGKRGRGNLCSGHGYAHNRCGPGLRCKVTGANIGICIDVE